MTGGDRRSIRQLYVDLGDDMWEVGAADPDAIPVLSAPETLPVVTGCLEGSTGLVLDAGCGPNPAVAVALAADGRKRVVALDIGWGTVRTAEAIAERAGRRLLGVVGDLEALPFRGGAFDALVCDDTIEHVPDDARGVAELARVLRAGGLAVLATPNRDSAVTWRWRLHDRWHGRHLPDSAYYVSKSHLREYRWKEFETLIAPVFRMCRREPVGWRQSRKRVWASRILHLPGVYRVAQMIVVVAQPRRDGGQPRSPMAV